MSLPGPRLVEIQYNKAHTGLKAAARIPSALSVCKESRCEALRCYTLAFGTDKSPPHVYFDFSVDILFVNHFLFPLYDGVVQLLDNDFKDIEKVRALALCSSTMTGMLGGPALLRKFTDLETVTTTNHGSTFSRKDLVVSLLSHAQAERTKWFLDVLKARSGLPNFHLCMGYIEEVYET